MTDTSQLRPNPANIAVPRTHGQILIEPPMPTLRTALQTSAAAPAGTLLNIPLATIRARARQDLLTAIERHAALINAPAPGATALDRPWVLAGHQVEFYHPGVWAKVLVADALARQTNNWGGAVAIDLLVDHDVVDHPGFDVPIQQPDGRWQRKSVTLRPPTHVAADGLSIPTPAEFDAWDSALATHPAAHTDSLAFILAALTPPNSQLPITNYQFTPWMSRARQQLEAALDLNVHHVPTSGLCESAAWSLFVLAWIAHADAWTAVYNRHLAAYRHAHDIHNDHHPMPDLHRDGLGGGFELPFWIYRPGQPRSRLTVHPNSHGIEIHHDSQIIPVPFQPSSFSLQTSWNAARQFAELLATRHLIIRPRALTLTMFVRLFISDLFIHGIGGALYDQITNGIIEELFGFAPAYACVSAAWLLPLGNGASPITPAEISDLRHYRHHLRHNPQSGIDPFTALKTGYAELIAQRQSLVRQIAASMATNRKAGRAERLALYRQLHAIIDQLHAKAPQVLGKVDAQLAAATTALEQDKILHYREYYFALHTMDSLRALIHKIRSL